MSSNLTRVTAKIFAGNATKEDNVIGQFGSALSGTKVYTTDIDTIQALPAYEQGWSQAVISNRNYPTLQEMNGVMKTMSYQTAYNMQKGVAEWDEKTTYFTGDICKGVGEGVLYTSLVDDNLNNPLTDETKWQKVDLGNGSGSYKLGQIVKFDHILTYEETQGFARLGSYLHKDGVKDEYYGYPKTYEKWIEEYKNSTKKAILKPNCTFVGNPKEYDNVLSNFSIKDYGVASVNWLDKISKGNTFEFVAKFRTGNNITNIQTVLWQGISIMAYGYNAIGIIISNTTETQGKISYLYSYDSNNQVFTGSYTLQPNTDYWVKIEFTGNNVLHYYSINGKDFILEGQRTTSTKLKTSTYPSLIGAATNDPTHTIIRPFNGQIDLNGCYLKVDDEMVWEGTKEIANYYINDNGKYFFDIKDKAVFDAIYNEEGVAWYYGVDEVNDRILLPRIKDCENIPVYIVVGNTSEVEHLTTTVPEGEIIEQVYKNKDDIANKADIDLLNTTPALGFYQNTFEALCPDLTKGISKPSSGFTADEDGWLYCDSVDKGFNNYVIFNGKIVFWANIGNTGLYPLHIANMLPITKGTVVTTNIGQDGTLGLTFYPIRGSVA